MLTYLPVCCGSVRFGSVGERRMAVRAVSRERTDLSLVKLADLHFGIELVTSVVVTDYSIPVLFCSALFCSALLCSPLLSRADSSAHHDRSADHRRRSEKF